MTTAAILQLENDEPFTAGALLDLEAAEVAEDWRELCHWDPELPPDTEPPVARLVIAALADALRRPQPLGWGTDEAVLAAMREFTEQAGPLAIAELICLREAVSRRLRGRVPQVEVAETWSRLQMAIDRAMLCAARRATAQLERDARVDALTGVLNRRAFVMEMGRELSRVARHHGRFSLVMVDLDGLKAVNDTLGHNAGDARLQALADALRKATRQEDSAYRIGGDEFAMCLPEASAEEAEGIIARVAEAAGPAHFSWGVSACPDDGDTVDALVAAADAHLYRRRAEAQRSRSDSRSGRVRFGHGSVSVGRNDCRGELLGLEAGEESGVVVAFGEDDSGAQFDGGGERFAGEYVHRLVPPGEFAHQWAQLTQAEQSDLGREAKHG